MDENWLLRPAGRPPTGNEAQLLETANRVWPSALALARKRLSELTPPEPAFESVATEIWEQSLRSVLGTMEKLGEGKISDLDAYLFAIFSNRLNRYLSKERRRQRTIQLLPSMEELAQLKGAQDPSWVDKIESGILLKEALARTDEWFRVTAWYYSQRYSWPEIGRLFGLTKEQARKRFEYGIQKLRKLLREPPEKPGGHQ